MQMMEVVTSQKDKQGERDTYYLYPVIIISTSSTCMADATMQWNNSPIHPSPRKSEDGIRRPKSATAKKRQKQLERRRRFQSMTEEERRRAARLIKRRKDSFTIYFPRVLRNIHMGFTLSQESLNILDSFVKDMFERIATEASNLARYTRRSIINSRDIQSAVYLLLPGELSKRATTEGTLALFRYISKQRTTSTSLKPKGSLSATTSKRAVASTRACPQ
ncbi:histone H2B [Cricetulus griseus]|nr:histone H2B [Cricetulus griseus]